ncbi:N-acetylmuramoyl-L-alanine amidase, partial [Alphaproteobacteria bacterium]|nr:N-acetylmuramoyl-L-alanine amidase [Alphaproteobacteria bacterium]
HCSDTENNKDLNALDIHKMHLDFGWDGIGYHKIICRSGKIENGRPEYWIGAHVKGYNNISLGVCLIGRDEFTIKQFSSLESVLRSWKALYPKTEIIGHCNTGKTDKTCPNFDVATWCKDKNL